MKGINNSIAEHVQFDDIARMMLKRVEHRTITCGADSTELLKYRVSVKLGNRYLLQIIFTRDEGTHSIGFTKNPENERCYNLTFSFQGADGNPLRGTERMKRVSEMRRIARNLMESFFGNDSEFLLIEPPISAGQKQLQIWGVRLFCDEDWEPLPIPQEEGMFLFKNYFAS